MNKYIPIIICILLLLSIISSCNQEISDKKSQVKSYDYKLMFDNKIMLTKCSIFKIDDNKPSFMQFMEEGNIAYYALIAQAEKDKALAKKVAMASTKNNLWEYGYGYGETAEDSALVIESLITLRLENKKIDKALETIVQNYYDKENGCFATILANNGRAPYWHGCSTETTAHIAYLLYMNNKERYQSIIEKASLYILSTSEMGKYWKSRWFPGTGISTYYSLRLLSIFKEKYKESIEKVLNYLVETQNENGSWNNSIIETSTNIMTLKLSLDTYKSINKAKTWLMQTKTQTPENILYYWFENQFSERIFFNCYDNGEIAKAWKKIALEK